jgi:hypothetical protein
MAKINCKETACCQIKTILQHLSLGIRKTKLRYLSQDSKFLGTGLNRGFLEYEAGLLSIRMHSNLTEIRNLIENMKLESHFHEERCILKVEIKRRNFLILFRMFNPEHREKFDWKY